VLPAHPFADEHLSAVNVLGHDGPRREREDDDIPAPDQGGGICGGKSGNRRLVIVSAMMIFLPAPSRSACVSSGTTSSTIKSPSSETTSKTTSAKPSSTPLRRTVRIATVELETAMPSMRASRSTFRTVSPARRRPGGAFGYVKG
jgi:hypothetical protein